MLRPICLVLLVFVQLGCRFKSAQDHSNESNTATEAKGKLALTDTTNSSIRMFDLGISDAISPDLPSFLTSSKTTIGLRKEVESREQASNLLSREVCDLKTRIKSTLNTLRQISDIFCEIESRDQILRTDKKYHFFTDNRRQFEPNKVSIWIEPRDKSHTRISLCVNDKLRALIDIEAYSNRRTKGHFTISAEDSAHHTLLQGLFDNKLTAPERTYIYSQSHQFSRNSNSSIVDKSAIVLNAKSRSVVLNSSSGNYTSISTGKEVNFSMTGLAKFGENVGSALVRYEDVGAFRSFFDIKGRLIPPLHVHPLTIAEGLSIAPEELLPFTEAGFRPTSFPMDAWDCSDTAELAFHKTRSEVVECSRALNLPRDNCGGPDFAFGHKENIDEVEFRAAIDSFEDVETIANSDPKTIQADDEGQEETIGSGDADEED